MIWLSDDSIFSRDTVNVTISSMHAVKLVLEHQLQPLLQMNKFQVKTLIESFFSDLTADATADAWLQRLIKVLGEISFICPCNRMMDELVSIGKPAPF